MENINHTELLELDAAKYILGTISQTEINSDINNIMNQGFYIDEFLYVVDADPFQFMVQFEKLLSALNLTLPDKEKAIWVILKYYLKRIANELDDPLTSFREIMISVSSELYSKWEFYGVQPFLQLYECDLDEIQSNPNILNKNKAIQKLKKDMIAESKIWLKKYGDNLKCIATFDNELNPQEIEAIKKLIAYCNGSAEIALSDKSEIENFKNLTKSLSIRLHKDRGGLAVTNMITKHELESLLKSISLSKEFIDKGIQGNNISLEYKNEWFRLINFITRDYKRWLHQSKHHLDIYEFNSKERKIKRLSTILIGLLGYFAPLFYYNIFFNPTIGQPIDLMITAITSIIPLIYSLMIGNILSKLLLKHIRNGYKNYGRIFWYGGLSYISITVFTHLTMWLLFTIPTLKTPLFSLSKSIIELTTGLLKLPYSLTFWIGWGLSGLLAIGIYKLYRKILN